MRKEEMHSERRRRVWAVLVVVVAACSGDPAATTDPETTVTAESPDEATTTTVATTTTTAPDPEYRWEVGDCLVFEVSADLPYEPFGSEPLATCEDSHTHEVYFTGSFSGGEEAGYPETIDTDIRDICTGAFVDSLGVLPVESGFDILMYLPDADEWADGLRYQACLAYLPDSRDTFRELTGDVVDNSLEFLLDISEGTCFPAIYSKLATVECSQSHLAEAIGTITHTAEPSAPFPGEAELEFFGLSECSSLLGEYLVESDSVTVAAIARPFSQLEWDAGWRELTCLAFAVGPDFDIAPVTGSFAEPGWTVVTGQQQA